MYVKDESITAALQKLDCAIDYIVDLYSVEYEMVRNLYAVNDEKLKMLLKVFDELESTRLHLSLYEFIEK